MLVKILSGANFGLSSQIIEVETDISSGFPGFEIIGLADRAIEESKERVKLAIKNSGLKFPSQKKIVINLAPADLKKEGPIYDLPIALGILFASQQIPENLFPKNSLFLGELSLNGDLKHTKGVLPLAILAKEKNLDGIFLPKANLKEASLVKNLKIYPLERLRDFLTHISGVKSISPVIGQGIKIEEENFEIDMAYIKGQEKAKRALEIAAAGAHNLLMSGPPGAGKTLLAKTLPSILPRLTEEEILEVSKIYSIAGLLSEEKPYVIQRPFRSPHHTISDIALIGGGQLPKPGEISLAHRGVLFLDELPEFSRHVLETLRQPLEEGFITISRAKGSLTFPARFIFIASKNPCPCGYYGDPHKPCICTPTQIIKYHKKISGPLLDRIDLYLEVPRLEFEKLSEEKLGESSKEIKKRIEKAREIQRERFKGLKILTNSEMGQKEIKKFCQISKEGQELLKEAVEKFYLSARAYYRILKVARTIADLANEEKIALTHIAEAIQYRLRKEEEIFNY
ncbi:MAG: YifB family Mg chelatase-like AAA ATPase [Patescibacteria group bacterium]